ncbi:MAG: ABC transporter [Methylocystis sp.]|nr:MAG: ABC transporter [Methylocystis sp.]
MSFSFRRLYAMMLRYTYVLRSSGFRLLEIIYWPVIQLFTWGFLQTYLMKAQLATGAAAVSGPRFAAGVLVGGVLFLDILLRAQQGFSFSFLEEMWSRNMANLLMSPLRMSEFAVALMTMSFVRLAIATVPVSIVAIYVFDFNMWSLGLATGAFFALLLIFAWCVGLFICGLLLRYGMGAESLVWALMFAIQPLGAVFYPVSVLPGWLQVVSWSLPPTYVFEGLRGVVLDHVVRWDLLAQGFVLDLVLFTLAAFWFSRLLKSARVAGTLLQTGE